MHVDNGAAGRAGMHWDALTNESAVSFRNKLVTKHPSLTDYIENKHSLENELAKTE